MGTHSFLRSRRSIRRFKSTTVEKEIINRIIETATFAPSAHNSQPWRFAVTTSIEGKNLLNQILADEYQHDLRENGIDETEIEELITRSKNRIINAPAIIVLCLDINGLKIQTELSQKRADGERLMAIQSVAAAGLQLQFAALVEGLGSVWVCSPLFAQHAVTNGLHLPTTWEPQAMFFLGYPSGNPTPKQSKPLETIIKYF